MLQQFFCNLSITVYAMQFFIHGGVKTLNIPYCFQGKNISFLNIRFA